MLRKIIDKFFRDNHGKVVLWQSPNVPLLTWLGLTIIHKFHSTNALHVAAQAALLYWAVLEVFSGASYFRRTLGATIGALTIASLAKQILG